MAASDLEPVSVESRFCWFSDTPNYRPIWVMEVEPSDRWVAQFSIVLL